MHTLVSIIMPVFNSSKYLHEAISSVIDQKHKNWELICVNDGSTDDSLKLLEKIASQDSRIQVYSQSNLGAASARKFAIKKASGAYVSYLDADDRYSEDYLFETLKIALSTDADVVMPILISNWTCSNEYNFNDLNGLKENNEIDPKKAFLRTFPWTVHGLNLYKVSHIKKYALTEISDVDSYNADELLTRFLLLYSSKIIISKGVYFYRGNLESATRIFSIKKIKSLEVNSKVFDLAIKEGFDRNNLIDIAYTFFVERFSLKCMYLKNKKEINKIEREWFETNINKRFNWESYRSMIKIKRVKFYFFDILPLSILSLLVFLKKILNKQK